MSNKIIQAAILILLITILGGCGAAPPDLTTPCLDRKALFCEDFEGIDPQLEISQLVDSTAFDQWWLSADHDQDLLFPDFPQGARTRTNLIVLSEGNYQNSSSSFLYTREIDLSPASRASLSYNLIYRTEKSWDGLIVFAVKGGVGAVNDPENWIPLTPSAGYPDRVLMNGVLVPGYSGISPGWIHGEIDLAQLTGSKVILGFYFTADKYENNWGAALDDIIIEADKGSIANDTAGLIDLPLGEVAFPPDPLISLDLPRANTLSSIPCLGEKDDVLGESQRAVIKAVSQSGDFYLILHPATGSLCWVEGEDIWVDGDQGSLPRLAEKSVVSYSPIMPFSRTPIVNDPSCGSGLSSDLPLSLDAALVSAGVISEAVFVPVFPGAATPEGFDPRVGNKAEMPAVDPGPAFGGKLWIKQDQDVYSCQPDRVQPGRVICQDLALSLADPLNLEICWQGWDETHSCPPGYYFDPSSSGCVPDDGSTACEPACSDGYLFDPGTGLCLIDTSPAAIREDPNSCPDGFDFNPAARICVGREYSPAAICPPGTYYSLESQHCLLLENPAVCPDGYTRPPGSGDCLPDTHQALISCQMIQVELPVQEVTVKKASRCLKIPDDPNQLVSSLDPFDKAEILGLGEDGKTLVIINPAYQIPCWAPLESFYLDKINLDILPIIPSQ